jgi:hypothetical protein
LRLAILLRLETPQSEPQNCLERPGIALRPSAPYSRAPPPRVRHFSSRDGAVSFREQSPI